MEQKAIRGVNLGGWLVLERWITPSLFGSMGAQDEFSFMVQADDTARARLENHRDTFITEADFAWLAAHGIEAVRLPVGYWVFGDEPPYSGAIDYVDKAFDWAEAHGMRVLLDLHGAPGSQNGWDHSGRAGERSWDRQEENIVQTLVVIEQLATRYAGRPGLLGIELLNEPHRRIPLRTLSRYYTMAYKLVRAICGPDVWVVAPDGFRPRLWGWRLPRADYGGLYLDTHCYQTFSRWDRSRSIASHLRKAARGRLGLLRGMQQRHDVIVGEWSLTLDPLSLRGLNEAQQGAALRAYGAAQLISYDIASAWFYWTYRTEHGGSWSYRDMVQSGRLPSGY